MLLQAFDEHYKPQKIDWLGMSIKRLFKKRGDFDRVYAREMEREIFEQFNR
jgi:hypothetical protein